jgi:multiubiquitin
MTPGNENKDRPSDHKTDTIIVNGRPREFTGKEITYDQVVRLAYENPPYGENTIFTVTYKRGDNHKPEGSLVAGDSVKVKDGMVFNVVATDKS